MQLLLSKFCNSLDEKELHKLIKSLLVAGHPWYVEERSDSSQENWRNQNVKVHRNSAAPSGSNYSPYSKCTNPNID